MEGKVVSLYQVKHSLIYRIDFTPSAPIIEAKVVNWFVAVDANAKV